MTKAVIDLVFSVGVSFFVRNIACLNFVQTALSYNKIGDLDCFRIFDVDLSFVIFPNILVIADFNCTCGANEGSALALPQGAPRRTASDTEVLPEAALLLLITRLCSFFLFVVSPSIERNRSTYDLESEIDVDLLLSVSARLIGSVNFDSLDKLVHLLGCDVL